MGLKYQFIKGGERVLREHLRRIRGGQGRVDWRGVFGAYDGITVEHIYGISDFSAGNKVVEGFILYERTPDGQYYCDSDIRKEVYNDIHNGKYDEQ